MVWTGFNLFSGLMFSVVLIDAWEALVVQEALMDMYQIASLKDKSSLYKCKCLVLPEMRRLY